MEAKKLYRRVYRELSIINRRAAEAHSKKDGERLKAKLQYEKIKLVRENKPYKHVEESLKELESGLVKVPPVNSKKFQELVREASNSEAGLKHLENVGTFLRSQRVYTELIERYNPGLTMEQGENVRKTAQKVGLSVPEN